MTHTTVHFPTLASLADKVGQHLATSDWITIDQSRIDLFAQATGDHQWIHVDRVRAAAGPFGTTIAHGYLTLSLIPEIAQSAMAIDDVTMSVNYGLNRVRFMAPVRVGSQLRGRFKLLAFEPLEGGAQLVTEASLELQGSAKPACVAESVSRHFV